MKFARRAGYCSLMSALVFAPFAVVFRLLAVQTAGTMLAPVCMAVFWLVVILIAACLFYAVWGLACGHSRTAWDTYAAAVDRQTRANAVRECERQGIEPPSWLEP